MNIHTNKAMVGILAMSSIAIVVTAATIGLTQVNQKLATLLVEFNNPKTKTSIVFTALNVDADKVLDFGMSASYAKTGAKNSLSFSVNDLKYSYGDGKAPKASGQFGLAVNLVELLSQEKINQLGATMEDSVKQLAQRSGGKYGEALSVTAQLSEIKKDSLGNFQSARLTSSATIDFAKLPSDLKSEEVEGTGFKMILEFTPQGIKASFTVTMNPKYKGFQKNGTGAKEFIAKLLNDDKQMYDSIVNLVRLVDYLIGSNLR